MNNRNNFNNDAEKNYSQPEQLPEQQRNNS